MQTVHGDMLGDMLQVMVRSNLPRSIKCLLWILHLKNKCVSIDINELVQSDKVKDAR